MTDDQEFQPTNFFRWSTRYTPQSFEKKLQQKWTTGSGTEEWRDVPEVLDEASSIKP